MLEVSVLPLLLAQRVSNPYSLRVPPLFFLGKSGLRPEGLIPARGVAPSAFRPLRNILDCVHP